jgi:hypothetical protein
MKRLLVCILLSAFASQSFSQKTTTSTNAYVGTYFWTDAVQLQYCDQYGGVPDTSKALISTYKGLKFNVIRSNDSFVVIKILDFDTTKNTIKNRARIFTYNIRPVQDDNIVETKARISRFAANVNNHDGDQLYFKVSVDVFKKFGVKYSSIDGSLALGAVNFPFRYRLQKGQGDFSGAFNLGAAAGIKWGRDSLTKWSFTVPVLSFSISNINIDSVSATKNQSLLKSTNNFTALTIATGVIVENNKIQIGAFLGWDVLSRVNQLQYGWIYQQKPWISIGIGYSIFSSDKTSSSDAQVKNK